MSLDFSSFYTEKSNSNSGIVHPSDISDILSNTSSDQPVFNQLQYLDRNDLLVKVSRAIFEDFYQCISEKSSQNEEEKFKAVLQQCSENCGYAVKTIENLLGGKNEPLDKNTRLMLSQLVLEQCTYELILKMENSDELLKVGQKEKPTSFLTKLVREDEQFRRLTALLQWSEGNTTNYASEFSRIPDNAYKLNDLDNIYACTKIRGPVHVDSRFTDRIAAEDEETVNILNRVVFSFLRSGRLEDVKHLLEDVGLASLSTFIFVREFITNPSLSPLDPEDENFGLAKSRIFFKQVARDLIPIDDDRIQAVDQCIWATLSGHLPTLLSHANSTEDRLWAYLSCAIDALIDKALLEVHSKQNEELNAIKIAQEHEDDLPKDVPAIFTEIRNNETSPYYALFGHLAMGNWSNALDYISSYISDAQKEGGIVFPHELRFFTHFVLLLKLTGRPYNTEVGNSVIERFANLLVQMNQHALVPFYLFHLSVDLHKTKMVEFLETIEYESEQREVLSRALDVGFETADLCREVYERFKAKYPFEEASGDNDTQIAKSAAELLRAWRWLTYSGVETVWDAIIEANYLLRKLFLHQRMAEAVELLSIAPANFSKSAVEAFYDEFPGLPLPEKLADAQREYECYLLYFEAMEKFNIWQKHVESTPPTLPTKLSDENWARLDIRRRTEYELSMQKARDCLQKYIRLTGMLKKAAVDLLERLLKESNGWLVTFPDNEEDSADEELLERARDFQEVRKHYLFHVVKLLIDVHAKSDEPMKVLYLAELLMDPRYNIHKALTKESLRQLLELISNSGAALL